MILLAFTTNTHSAENSLEAPTEEEEAAPQLETLQQAETAPQGCPYSKPLEIDLPHLELQDQELVREALNLTGSHRVPVCAYYAESSGAGRDSQIEQFIPTESIEGDAVDPDQIGWTLISVDGRAPTEKELEEYKHRGGQLFPYRDYIDLLDFSQLRVKDRQADKLVLETVPTEAVLEEQEVAYLAGRVTLNVVIDTANRRLDHIRNTLNEPFKANAFIRVREFDQLLNFEYLPEVGEVVMTQMTMGAHVRFVVIQRKFNLNARLYDFSCPPILQPTTCPTITSEADNDTEES